MNAKAIKAIDIYKHKLSKGIFYLETEDSYWEEYALGYFEALIPPEARDFDYAKLIEPAFGEIMERAASNPLFGDILVTTVINFNQKLTDVQRRDLAEFSVRLPEGVFLVFGSCKGLIAADKAFMAPITAQKATQSELIAHIHQLYPNAADNGAITKLIDYTARDMVRIDTEMRKLVDYTLGRKVRADDVEQMVAPEAEYKIYEFSNAMSARSYLKAMEILQTLLLSGCGENTLFRLLISHYQRMFYAKTSPLGDQELAAKLGVKPYAVAKTKEAGARYSPMQIMNILNMLKEKEWEARSGKTGEKQAFQAAVSLLTAY